MITGTGKHHTRTIAIVLIAVFSIVRSAGAQSRQQVAQAALPSVVLLVMEDANGQEISLGSGFFIADGVVATNLHVIEGATRGYGRIRGEKTNHDITGTLAIDAQRDIVLLALQDVKTPTLRLGDSRKVTIGDQVYVIGNPRGLEGTFSQGIVSSIRKVGSDTLLQITAPISPGSSGGPVLNDRGEVIGVAAATFRGGQNLNFAIPVSYLKLLLSKESSVRPLSAKPPSRQDMSILSSLGRPNTEGVVASQLLWKYKSWGSGDYSFSLRNKLRHPVKEIRCLVIFYDRVGHPIDIDVVQYRGVIPGGLAKRVSSVVDSSVKRLTTPPAADNRYMPALSPTTKVDVRILGFQLVE